MTIAKCFAEEKKAGFVLQLNGKKKMFRCIISLKVLICVFMFVLLDGSDGEWNAFF